MSNFLCREGVLLVATYSAFSEGSEAWTLARCSEQQESCNEHALCRKPHVDPKEFPLKYQAV